MSQERPRPANLRDWLSPYVYLSNNFLSLSGVVLVTTAAILWLFLLPRAVRGGDENPYLNILSVMILPAAFFAGLFLIPLGELLRVRRERRAGRLPGRFPTIDLGSPELRRLLTFVMITTVINLIIGSQLMYQSVHYMETVGFCGQTCHTVMKPEFTAYQNSPHSRVECVKCHIGPGASWAVKSKIDGLRQVWAVTWNTYSRPIPTPVHTLRPARETCETCHWPQKFASDRVRVIDKFADDEQNSRTRTVLLMKLGGGIAGEQARRGIHGAHLGPGIAIRYAPGDEARQKIPFVQYSNASTGRAITYSTGEMTPEAAGRVMRVMDCMDCHNRPSHAYELPERAIDRVMDTGAIDPSLPFAKKQGLEILKANYTTDEDAAAKIPAAFENFYRTKHPDIYTAKRAAIERGGKALLSAFERNVFPAMNVKWGSYPNNLGHNDFPGCFRCHDDSHASIADKKITMSQDCNLCHNLLAMDEANPKVLADLGLTQ